MDVKGVQGNDLTAVLAQMRALRAQAQFRPAMERTGGLDRADAPANAAAPGRDVEFGAALKSALQTVNGLQKTSSATATGFLEGKHNDLVKVMVDSQKSSLGFQGLLQVRNRMISAYQDIMNMPI